MTSLASASAHSDARSSSPSSSGPCDCATKKLSGAPTRRNPSRSSRRAATLAAETGQPGGLGEARVEGRGGHAIDLLEPVEPTSQGRRGAVSLGGGARWAVVSSTRPCRWSRSAIARATCSVLPNWESYTTRMFIAHLAAAGTVVDNPTVYP